MIKEWLKHLIHPETAKLLEIDTIINQEYFEWINQTVTDLYSKKIIYPRYQDIFKIFSYDWSKSKVIILGQDPYFSPNLADGLAFSTENSMTPSLKIIFKELERVYFENRTRTNLSDWAAQGVLLLNTSLTVEENKPNSHSKFNWDYFVASCINRLLQHKPDLVILAWGTPAKKFLDMLDIKKDTTVLTSIHPVAEARASSAARRRFTGNNHFIITNDILELNGYDPIDWIGSEKVTSMFDCMYTDTTISNDKLNKYKEMYNMEIEYI